MTGAYFIDSPGLAGRGAYTMGMVSARNLGVLLGEVVQDATLRTIMGTSTHNLAVTGSNPRSIAVTHTINRNGTVKLPGHKFGKTGTDGASHAVSVWEHPYSGEEFITCVLAAPIGQAVGDLHKLTLYGAGSRP